MRTRLLFIALGSFFLAANVSAQATADDYFNQAARHYVKEDKLAALKTLDMGLRQFPGDARMLKLAEELLKEQQKQQQQQQQQQQKQQQQQQQQGQQKEEQQKEQDGQERSAEEQHERQGQMTKEDAEQMLDALEHNEQDVQDRVRTKLRPGRRVAIEKDW